MSHKKFILSCILFCSLIFSSFNTFAWQIKYPEPDERFSQVFAHLSDRKDKRTEILGLTETINPASGVSSDQVTIAIGEPGLNFRHVQTFGTSEVGYLTDSYHLNAPSGLFIDTNDNLYVVEDHGYRLLRYNSSGENTLTLGEAGFCNDSLDPTSFCTPQDIAVDLLGNFWVATGNRVVKFDANGLYQTQLPIPNSEGWWSSGDDTTHFRSTRGVALDNINARLFVSDRNNHRVQVYSLVSGEPVYSATIGETGVLGDDNAHFYSPQRMVVDNLGRLYVVDLNNHRVQRCTLSGSWECAPFGPAPDSYYPRGISSDVSGNIYIYDSDFSRVVKCTDAGNCSDLVGSLSYSQDVAVDSHGNLFLGAYGHSIIKKYNSSGAFISNYLGTFHQSYFPDGEYIFSAHGVEVAADGSLYVTELNGQRLLKFNSSGIRQWAVGDPGAWGEGNYQFNSPEGNPAISAAGLIYVPDGNNNRIQIFDANGSYISSFGSQGIGDYQFNYPAGIFISPENGYIYIADVYNSRVQVFNSNHVYIGTIGETGVGGSDDAHFDGPYDVAVDEAGFVYVADYYNFRVQKCTFNISNYTCATFSGDTGNIGDAFDYLQPQSVEVDQAGRVYVVDQGNNRIQVFDTSGAYLTTIGGAWGSRSGEFRLTTGLALDGYGNVYVGDFINNRVEKFSPGIPGWRQANINAFGDLDNGNIHTLTPFAGSLYAGTWNGSGNGAQIWKMDENHHWTQAASPGFGDGNNVGINHLLPYNGQLYAGVRNDYTGASIYRSIDGSTWNPVVTDGFGGSLNTAVYTMESFNGQIYAGTAVWDEDYGAEIWRSSSGDFGTWEQVVSNGFDSIDNYIMRNSAVHNGALFFTASNFNKPDYASTSGALLIRSTSGDPGSWTKAALNGFGDTNNCIISGLVSYEGYLYASTTSWYPEGIQVWRCQACDSQDSWEKVVDNGFGNTKNEGYSNLIEYDNNLYVVIGNRDTGMEVWRSETGDSGEWYQLMTGGFGDIYNVSPYFKNLAVFNQLLFIGAENYVNGPEIWEMANNFLYLPFVIR